MLLQERSVGHGPGHSSFCMLTPAGTERGAGLVGRLHSFDEGLLPKDRVDEVAGVDLPVSAAKFAQVASLLGDWYGSLRLDAPGPGEVSEVVEALAGAGGVPVDKRDR
jgi:hypothetical protein